MESILREWKKTVSVRCITETAHDTMADQSIYINIISSEAYGGVRTMAFPFGKNGMANSLSAFLCSERSGRMNYLKEKFKPVPMILLILVEIAINA